MLSPATYVNAYADLWSWMLDDGEWNYVGTPIINYLQSGKDPQSSNAKLAYKALMSKLVAVSKQPSFATAKTFNFQDYDYINQSINRTFIGKACPWEIQETIQLASLVGAADSDSVYKYCTSNLGVDCGGFVANFWGEGVPHMADPNPFGATGFLPRSFWADSKTWPDVLRRRRTAATAIEPGDAAVFFKDIKDNNPDIAKQRDSNGKLIDGTGSEAFHIGVVNRVGASANTITMLEVAESSGAPSIYGGNGVNVRAVGLTDTGKSGSYVYAAAGSNERIYFVAPPAGAGPEMPYSYGDE
jgi:hypothetical protein